MRAFLAQHPIGNEDLPLLREDASGPTERLAAFADPWPGAVALYRDDASDAAFAGLSRTRSIMGRLDAPLPPAASGRWDRRAARTTLSFGALSSRNDAEILGGANVLAVETAAGWEVLQCQGAVLGEDGVCTLSGLLRGQAGTEDPARNGASAGARCALVSATQADISYPRDLVGQALRWQAGPEQDLPDTDRFADRDIVLGARALRPLAPAHLKADPVAQGVRLSWIRRTRFCGDGWEGEVPLGEAYERYRVFILDGAAQKRAVETGAPEFLYTEAMTAADFGGALPPSAAVEVCQLSDLIGEGLRARRGLA